MLIAAIVAAVVLTAAGMAAWATAGDVPRGVRVLGVKLGGLSAAAARKALHHKFDGRAGEPAPIVLDGRPGTLLPEDAGMALDVTATVQAATRLGVFGGRELAPVVRLDESRLAAALRRDLDPAHVTVVHPTIAYRGVTPVPTYAKAGLDLDLRLAAAAVRSAWLTGRTATIELVQHPAELTDEQVDALVAGPATVAVAAPVTVVVGARTIVLDRASIAAALTFHGDKPVIDGAKLHVTAAKAFAAVETPAPRLKFTVTGGTPHVVPAPPGTVVDLDALVAALPAVLAQPAPRTVTGALVTRPAGVTDADLAALGIKEQVSTFTTYFQGGATSPRTQNIMTIAREVNGAIVKPGETFSLNGHTGERDYDSGYQDAPVIVGGKLEPGVGGGASQFTTTLFNAAYYAGLQDVEHKPHSFYFSRYPAVIESTIFYPTLDLKFKNTTPYGILIATATTGKSVTVTLWSTKFYDSVTTVRSSRRNFTSPTTVYREPGPRCIASSGLPGFTQDAWRIIRKDGKEIKREKFTWRYDPEPRFMCAADPASGPGEDG